MINERHEELAALAAFDLLDEAEQRELAAALAAQPELQALVDQLRATASAVALTAPDAAPPERLKARLMTEISRNATYERSAPPAEAAAFPAWKSWLLMGSLGAAAALAVTTIWFGQRYLAATAENDLLHQQASLADVAVREARNQLLMERLVSSRELTDTQAKLAQTSQQLAALDQKLKAEGDLAHYKIAALTSLLGNSPEALAVAVWDPAAQKGFLKVSHLPALAADKDYQLWVIDPQYPAPVDGGVFHVDPATGEARIPFQAGKPIGASQKFAVSVEKKGGVPQHEGPIVLLSQ